MKDDVAQLLTSLRLKTMAELVDAEVQHAENDRSTWSGTPVLARPDPIRVDGPLTRHAPRLGDPVEEPSGRLARHRHLGRQHEGAEGVGLQLAEPGIDLRRGHVLCGVEVCM